jgi:hypothetical protein
MEATRHYGRPRPDPVSLRFRAAGLLVEVVLPGPEPHLVVRVPCPSGHHHHGPDIGPHEIMVWLGPGTAAMCCCADWWGDGQCGHIGAALAVISEVEEVTR